jgi:hypothetical protein
MSRQRYGSALGGLTAILTACGWALLGLLLGGGCGDGDAGSSGPQATIALVSPLSPLGLHYGEQVTLVLRYRQLGQATAGVTLSLHIDNDTSGATLSADRVVTNDRGEASILLTAGAAETAFHVLVNADLAADLAVDIAVSRYAFGNLDIVIDGSSGLGPVALVRAALLTSAHCEALSPTPKLGAVLRSQQSADPQAVLPFSTLLVQPYTAIGRAEDTSGRLLGYGCIDLPDQLLRTGLRPVVPIPLSPVFPSPIGSYQLALTAQSSPMLPAAPGPFDVLACASGLGQLLLEATLRAIPAASSDLALRLGKLRAAVDGSGCRVGASQLDGRLHALLALSSAGSSLAAVAADVVAIQKSLQLASLLGVTMATSSGFIGSHTLLTATLANAGGSRSATYSLANLPVPSVSNLLLGQSAALLTVPQHQLTLRLPSLWRQAVDELALTPRGLTMTPAQLLQAAVSSAKSSGRTGCDAVEQLLCTGVSAPCLGQLLGPCATATTTAASDLTATLADLPAPSLDLTLAFGVRLDDPDGTLLAQQLSAGQLSGSATTAGGLLPLTGTLTGSRKLP